MAVGHSAASVRPHGRRWIATSTTSCARASASPVTVSPCFGPCQLPPPHPAPVPARERDGAYARARPSWQMRTRPAHRSCCGSATAPSWARTRASWTPRPSRPGLRRRGARRRPPARSEARSEARRAARDGLASREARPVRQRSVYYMASSRHTVARPRPLASGKSNAACLAALLSDEWSHVSSFLRQGKLDTQPHLSAVFCAAARSALAIIIPCNCAAPPTERASLRVGYGSQPRQHPQSRQP